jgi:FAD binding domain
MEAACSVLIVGGGPCGLMLANELGMRGIDALLVDDKPSTAFNPQANATQARTMEHYRRLGFADEIRSLGLPPDYPTDIAYFTRFATYELARFSLPSAREARTRVATLSGSWSAAELPHRASQKFVEAVLRRHAQSHSSISINYSWRLIRFTDHHAHVDAEVEQIKSSERHVIHAAYLVAADGARSLVRRQLGFQYMGDAGAVRDFFGGRMYALYLRAPDFYRVVSHAPAWMYVTSDRDRRAEPELEEDTPEGARARAHAGSWLDTHARTEFNIPGITFGARYDGSPIVVSGGSSPPPDSSDTYIQTACPGGRAPHAWLDDGRSLFDAFGLDWTLLRFQPGVTPGDELLEAARRLKLELQTVDLQDPRLRDLYEADLALIRPDQIVAWRGSGRVVHPEQVIATVSGWL